jgi:hypothetical protein
MNLYEIENRVLLNKPCPATVEEKKQYEMFGYRGCGKAWAAKKDGEIVALLPMGGVNKHQEKLLGYEPPSPPPRPVLEALRAGHPKGYYCDDVRGFELLGPRGKHEACEVAIAAGLISATTKGGRPVSGSTLCSRIRAIIAGEQHEREKWDSEAFAAWRLFARNTLAKQGEVISGMCSCHEFIAKDGAIYAV